MANKRVSELQPITSVELASEDLLFISDVSAYESKKMELQVLGDFILSGGNLSGSLFGTASYAVHAASASYAPIQSASYAPTASWALNIATASYVVNALSSSYSQLSAFAVTASFALTSSVQLVFSSSFSDYSRTASFLLLTPGVGNGTASYALSASHFLGAAQISASYSSTSSWALNIATASRAVSSVNADTASLANTASFLVFRGLPNGTASYALAAATIANSVQDYGIFVASTQSISSSHLDTITVTPALGGLKRTNIEAYGTLRIPFTSSVGPTDGDIELFIVDRQYGYSRSLETSPVFVQINGGTNISGTLKYPFTLRGQELLGASVSSYGIYSVYVTASNGVFIESTRTARFKITSESDQVLVSNDEPMRFISYPSNAIMLFSSSLHPGEAFYGSASQVTFSGSSDVTELLIPPGTVATLQYTWTLTSASRITVDGNGGLTRLGGIPTSCISMSAANCGLTELPPLISGSVSYLNVPNNTIVSTFVFPTSMSYINISNNFFITLPVALPPGLSAIVADGVGVTVTPYVLPDTILSMSFANCIRLNSYLAPAFPSSLTYWNSSGSPNLSNLPTTVPSGVIYMDMGSNNIPDTTISSIAAGLVANGLNNGYLSIRNNQNSSSAAAINANITTLRTRGWTVVS